ESSRRESRPGCPYGEERGAGERHSAAAERSGSAPHRAPAVIGLDHKPRASESCVGSGAGHAPSFSQGRQGSHVTLAADVLLGQAALLLHGSIDDQGIALRPAAMLRVVAGHCGAQVRLESEERTDPIHAPSIVTAGSTMPPPIADPARATLV